MTKNRFSHLVVWSHVATFGFICPGYDLSSRQTHTQNFHCDNRNIPTLDNPLKPLFTFLWDYLTENTLNICIEKEAAKSIWHIIFQDRKQNYIINIIILGNTEAEISEEEEKKNK